MGYLLRLHSARLCLLSAFWCYGCQCIVVGGWYDLLEDLDAQPVVHYGPRVPRLIDVQVLEQRWGLTVSTVRGLRVHVEQVGYVILAV